MVVMMTLKLSRNKMKQTSELVSKQTHEMASFSHTVLTRSGLMMSNYVARPE